MSRELEVAERLAKLETYVEVNSTRIAEIHADVKKLIGFRAWLLGAAAAVSGLVSLLLNFIK